MIDPFSPPRERIREEDQLRSTRCRTSADHEVIAVICQLDEEWATHELCGPLLEQLSVEFAARDRFAR